MVKRNASLALMLVFTLAFSNAYSATAKVELIKRSVDCPAGAAGIVAALAAPLITEGIGFLKEYVKERAESYEALYSATGSSTLAKQCGTTSSLGLHPAIEGFRFGYGDPAKSGDEFFTSSRVLLEANVEYFPVVDIAGALTPVPNPQLLRIVPSKLKFVEPVAKRGKEKDLVFTLTFTFHSAYDAKSKSTTEVKRTVVLPTFEGLVKGTEWAISDVASHWIPIPMPDPEAGIPTNQAAIPFSIDVSAKETDLGNGAELWMRLSSAIDASAEDLSAAITKAVLGDEEGDSSDESEEEK